MSIQAAQLIYGQASASAEDPARDEVVYTFSGALNGAGRKLSFSLFGLAQGSNDAGAAIRAAARQLLHDIYLPLLPWDATDRPNALDHISAVVNAPQPALTEMALAIIVDNRAYMGWQGDGRVFVITDSGVARFDFEDASAEPVAAQIMSPGAYLLLCTGGLWRNLSDDEALRAVQQAQSVQAACDQLVSLAHAQDSAGRPLLVLIHQPA